jgi:hypothetical protein
MWVLWRVVSQEMKAFKAFTTLRVKRNDAKMVRPWITYTPIFVVLHPRSISLS